MVHGLRLLSEKNSLHVIVGIDFSNAFNSIHRSVIAKEVRDKFPEVTSWFDLCYGKPSKLLVKGGDPVSSERGGRSPGPPSFSLLPSSRP